MQSLTCVYYIVVEFFWWGLEGLDENKGELCSYNHENFFGGVWKDLMRLKVNYVITTMRKPHKNDYNHQCDQPSSVTCLIPIHSVLEQVF